MCKVVPIGGTTCPECDGLQTVLIYDKNNGSELIDCPTCDGKGWVLEQDEEIETN